MAFHTLFELVRILSYQFPGVEVHGHHAFRFEHFHGFQRICRPHCEVIANRQKSQIDLVHPADKLELHSQAGIARMVDSFAIDKNQKSAGGAGEVRSLNSAAMESGSELDRSEIKLAVTANMHGMVFHILGIHIPGKLIGGYNQRPAALGDRDCVPDMVPVAMSEQDKLLEQIKQQLDASADHLDAATQSRLTQIRSQVLASGVKSKWSWQMPVMALGSTAAVAALTVSILWAPDSMQQTSLEDLPLLTANDAFELIEEVEFYQWLADESQRG